MQFKSIVEMAGGAIIERVDYVMANVIVPNINDANTKADAARELTVKIKILPGADRNGWKTAFNVIPKIVPTEPIITTFYQSYDEGGNAVIMESPPQIPGQISMSGGEQEEPVLLKLVSGGK